jgi:hypothetical protein
MTKARIDGYHARRVLLDNAALLLAVKRNLRELRHEVASMTGRVLVAEALRQIEEVRCNELMIRTGQ